MSIELLGNFFFINSKLDSWPRLQENIKIDYFFPVPSLPVDISATAVDKNMLPYRLKLDFSDGDGIIAIGADRMRYFIDLEEQLHFLCV